MKIVIATNNQHKIREMKKMFSAFPVELLSLKEIGFNEEIHETGTTFYENAFLKAKTVSGHTDLAVLADDSGLVIDALNGFPGVYSARFMENASYTEKMNAILSMMKGRSNREAYFICTLVLMYPDGKYVPFVGVSAGSITDGIKGKKGFGYDPVFYSNDLGKTFAEAAEDEKNLYSHRGKAVGKMIRYLGLSIK